MMHRTNKLADGFYYIVIFLFLCAAWAALRIKCLFCGHVPETRRLAYSGKWVVTETTCLRCGKEL
jgi:formate dehydrogenase maturation protein FdhE